jgi:hypothetical protein
MSFGFLEIQDPEDHIAFFIADKAFGLTLIHQVMDLFGEITAVAQVPPSSEQGFQPAQKALTRVIFQIF